MAKSNFEFTSNQEIDAFMCGDNTIEITGFADSIEGTKHVGKDNKALFKFVLNNNNGRRIRILLWDKVAIKYETSITYRQIIKLKRVLLQPVNQTFFKKENNIIPFEITCLNGSTIELLGKHISDHTHEQVTPTTIENCADFKGKLKITGFIKVVFKRLSGNFNSFGSGAIVNGNYKLRVHIANFQEGNNLLSTEGAHISIVGEIQKDKYDSIYFQVNETDDITKLDDQLLSTEQLKKGIYTPMKRKFSDDATEAGCSPNKRPNSVSSLLEMTSLEHSDNSDEEFLNNIK